jgi:hypothetical protein
MFSFLPSAMRSFHSLPLGVGRCLGSIRRSAPHDARHDSPLGESGRRSPIPCANFQIWRAARWYKASLSSRAEPPDGGEVEGSLDSEPNFHQGDLFTRTARSR